MLFVEIEQSIYVNIGNTVAIGHKKRFVSDKIANPFKPAARHRVKTCVNNSDLPFFGSFVMDDNLIILSKIKGDV